MTVSSELIERDALGPPGRPPAGRREVDAGRTGGVGLSMGGEEAIGAASMVTDPSRRHVGKTGSF
jgi:hypothetical protein